MRFSSVSGVFLWWGFSSVRLFVRGDCFDRVSLVLECSRASWADTFSEKNVECRHIPQMCIPMRAVEVASFALTMAFLQYTAMSRRRKERDMGFNI